MSLQPNRSLNAAPSRQGGILGLLNTWLGTKPSETNPQGTSDRTVTELLDRLSLTTRPQGTGSPDPLVAAAQQRLSRPGQADNLPAEQWEALAGAWASAEPAARATLTRSLAAGGVQVEASQDGRYVSFVAGDLRVIAEPATQRLRRTKGDTVLCYEGDRLAIAMKRQDDKVEVATPSGRQIWMAGTGQGFESGLPITPRWAASVPGEQPREPWASPLANDLKEPVWNSETRMTEYAPSYDQAVRQMGGLVLEASNADEPAADQYNCHSFSTTGGQGDLFDPFMRDTHPHWLNNPMYQLTNGPFAQLQSWQRVHPGDVIVYRKDGKVTHTGVVREVDDQGNPTLIESKFGVLGRYLHPPFDIPAQYGAPGEFFRPEAA